jgi:hypothetical protein
VSCHPPGRLTGLPDCVIGFWVTSIKRAFEAPKLGLTSIQRAEIQFMIELPAAAR